MIYLDTNIILRYLLEDNEKFFDKSKNIIENNTVFIKNEVLAEVVYVLNKTYQIPKIKVSETLTELLLNDNILVESKLIINLSLEIFASKNIDFVDAILCAHKKIKNIDIVSFDKKLNRCLKNQQ